MSIVTDPCVTSYPSADFIRGSVFVLAFVIVHFWLPKSPFTRVCVLIAYLIFLIIAPDGLDEYAETVTSLAFAGFAIVLVFFSSSKANEDTQREESKIVTEPFTRVCVLIAYLIFLIIAPDGLGLYEVPSLGLFLFLILCVLNYWSRHCED